MHTFIHDAGHSIEARIGQLSALLTHICQSPTKVHPSFYRAWGLLQACIDLETISYEVAEKIFNEIKSVPMMVFSDVPEYQLQLNALDIALEILADLPISFGIPAKPKKQDLQAEIEAIFWFIDESLLIPNAGFLYRLAYRLVRADNETALSMFDSRYPQYVAMARDSRQAVS